MTVFKDDVAVVTGASSGIGKAIALSLAENGATVCLVARRSEELEAIASASRSIPVKLLPYPADLSQARDLDRLVTRLRADFQHIDIIVHSAGVLARDRLVCAPIDDLERQFRTNVLAPFSLTQALLPGLRSNRGQIVFVNSSVGLAAPENLGQYSATKHALKAISDTFRKELNQHGIRVVNIYLGRTATPLQATLCAMENKTYRPEDLMQTADVAAVIINALSLPRRAEVTEIHMRSAKRL